MSSLGDFKVELDVTFSTPFQLKKPSTVGKTCIDMPSFWFCWGNYSKSLTRYLGGT